MFGLFGLAGKFSAVIGPIAFGVIIFVLLEPLGTVAYQVAILSLLGLMVLGYWIVRGVPEPPPEAGDAAAAALAGHARRGRARRGQPVTLVVAHRGASAVAPENTMEAFRRAVEAGADAIELDVHLTADGELAVIHDPTLDRTTDRTTTVATATMADVREADAGWAFPGTEGDYPFRGAGLTVPTLPEVLEWLPAGVGLAIEIKPAAAADGVVSALAGAPGP